MVYMSPFWISGTIGDPASHFQYHRMLICSWYDLPSVFLLNQGADIPKDVGLGIWPPLSAPSPPNNAAHIPLQSSLSSESPNPEIMCVSWHDCVLQWPPSVSVAWNDITGSGDGELSLRCHDNSIIRPQGGEKWMLITQKSFLTERNKVVEALGSSAWWVTQLSIIYPSSRILSSSAECRMCGFSLHLWGFCGPRLPCFFLLSLNLNFRDQKNIPSPPQGGEAGAPPSVSFWRDYWTCIMMNLPKNSTLTSCLHFIYSFIENRPPASSAVLHTILH